MIEVDGSYIPGTTSGPYPARPGNRVRAFIDGPQIMRRIGEAIAKAQHSVWLNSSKSRIPSLWEQAPQPQVGMYTKSYL